MIEGIKLAIDQFIANPQFAHDEVHAGLVEVTEYVDGYLAIFDPRGKNRDDCGVRLPSPPDKLK